MGTFAETSIVDYPYRVLTKGKQTSISVCSKPTEVCRFSVFRFQVTNGSCRFPYFPFYILRTPEIWRHEHGKFKRKTEPMQFSFINLLFATRANESLSFVRLLMKNQTELSVDKRT
jgi:hypothetical protein